MSEEKKKEWGDMNIEEKVEYLGQEMDCAKEMLRSFGRAIKKLCEWRNKLEAK